MEAGVRRSEGGDGQTTRGTGEREHAVESNGGGSGFGHLIFKEVATGKW